MSAIKNIQDKKFRYIANVAKSTCALFINSVHQFRQSFGTISASKKILMMQIDA